MYVFVCIYVTYLYAYMIIYVYLYTCMYRLSLCINSYKSISTIHVHVFIYVTYMCIYMWHICTHIWIYINVYTHTCTICRCVYIVFMCTQRTHFLCVHNALTFYVYTTHSHPSHLQRSSWSKQLGASRFLMHIVGPTHTGDSKMGPTCCRNSCSRDDFQNFRLPE